MEFLALLIALSLQQLVRPDSLFHPRAWVTEFEEKLRRWINLGGLRAAFLLSLVAIVTQGALSWVGPWLFGLPELLLTAAFLLWSLGGCDYHTAVERFIARSDENPVAAEQALAELWIPGLETNTAKGTGQAVKRITYAGYARWFAPVFWFVFLGPLAAVLYRVVATLAASPSTKKLRVYLVLLELADWLPTRVLALSFALVGDFLAVLHAGGARAMVSGLGAPALLSMAARAACNDATGARAYANLLYRSAGLWLLVVSLAFLFF